MPSQAWPYPRSKRDLIQVIIVVLVVLLVGCGYGWLQLRHYTKKPLTYDDVYRGRSALVSFASEAHSLSQAASDHHTFAHYQSKYFTTLDEQVQNVVDFMQSHHTQGKLENASKALQNHAHRLQKSLRHAKDEHDTNKLKQAASAFATLQRDIDQTEVEQ